MEDAHLAQRAADIRDVGQRVQKILLGVDLDPMAEVTEPVIARAGQPSSRCLDPVVLGRQPVPGLAEEPRVDRP